MATPLARGPSGRGGGKVHDIGPSPAVFEVTSFPTNLQSLSTQAIACRQIIISNIGVGTKVLAWTGPDGVAKTLDATNLQSVTLPMEAISLDAATTCTKVLVFF